MNILYRLWLVVLTFFTIILIVLLFAWFGILAVPWYILKGDLDFPVKIINDFMAFLDKLENKFDEQ